VLRAGDSEAVVALILRGPPDRLDEAVLRVRSVQGVRLVLRKDGSADEYFLVKRVKGRIVVGMG
jgi:hypothetical protein